MAAFAAHWPQLRRSLIVVGLVWLMPVLVEALNPQPIAVQLSQSKLVENSSFTVTMAISRPDETVPVVFSVDPGPRLSVQEPPDLDFASDELGGSRRIILTWHWRVLSAGYATLPALTVQFPDQSYQSAPLPLAIGLAGRPDIIPPDLVWQVPTANKYVGQVVPVSLVLRFAPGLMLPPAITLPTLPGASLEATGLTDTVAPDPLGTKELLRVPLAAYNFRARSAGRFELPAIKVPLGTFDRTASSVTITVLPLPAGLAETAPIGQFFLSLGTDQSALFVGKPFTVVLRIEGTGNLKQLRLPKLSATGLALQEPTEYLRVVSTKAGDRGVRELRYPASAEQSGKAAVVVETFKQFNPATGQVQLDGDRRLVLSILPASVADWRTKLLADSPSVRDWSLAWPQVINLALVLTVAAWLAVVAVWLLFRPLGPGPSRWRRPIRLGLVVIGLGCLSWYLWQWFGSQQQAAAMAPGLTRLETDFQAGRYKLAFNGASRVIRQDPNNIRAWYVAARASLALRQDVLALAAIHYAAGLAPYQPELTAIYQALQTALGLEPVPIQSWWLNPPTCLGLAAVAGMLTILLWRFRRRTGYGWIVAGSVVGALSVAAIVAFSLTVAEARRDIAFIKDGAVVLQRIPEANAQTWLRLPAGMQVYPGLSGGDFIQVQTAVGIRGWVRAGDLYYRPFDRPWRLWQN